MSFSTADVAPSQDDLIRRIRLDLMDGYDEELEMELEDRTVDELAEAGSRHHSDDEKSAHRQYFQ